MKKLVFCLILGFTAGIVFGQANVPAIVVSSFSTRGQAVTRDDAEGITELFMAELAKQSGVRVVDRTSIDRVVVEMRFQASDWSNSQKTAQLGSALNAEFLVRGQINQLGQQISFAITALDIKTLELVSSSTRNFNSDTIFSTGSNGIFNAMGWMAQEIASPVKTKMVQLAEQRKKEQEEREKQQQEQARLREQSQYSLVGTWTRGEFYGGETSGSVIYNSEKESIIKQNNIKGTGSSREFLIFSSDGKMEYYYESSNGSRFIQRYRRGTYIRRGDQVEFSISGTNTTLTGRNWSNWNNNYREFDEKIVNDSTSSTTSIEFRGGGYALIFWGTEYKWSSYPKSY